MECNEQNIDAEFLSQIQNMNYGFDLGHSPTSKHGKDDEFGMYPDQSHHKDSTRNQHQRHHP